MEFAGVVVLAVWGALWVGTLIDIGSWPDASWKASGQSRAVWFIVVFFFQFFGLIAYWVSARPRLRAAR